MKKFLLALSISLFFSTAVGTDPKTAREWEEFQARRPKAKKRKKHFNKENHKPEQTKLTSMLDPHELSRLPHGNGSTLLLDPKNRTRELLSVLKKLQQAKLLPETF